MVHNYNLEDAKKPYSAIKYFYFRPSEQSLPFLMRYLAPSFMRFASNPTCVILLKALGTQASGQRAGSVTITWLVILDKRYAGPQ